MKTLNALLTAMLALAMVTGSAIATETMVEKSAAPMTNMGTELRKQLSPNVFGYIADGVSEEEFRGSIDTHYGVAPAWEGRTEDPLGKDLRKHLSPNVFGYIADGVSEEVYRGSIDTHYGVAPTWEGRTEDTLGKELRKNLSPNAFDLEPIAD